MQICVEKPLRDFVFTGAAKAHIEQLTEREIDRLDFGLHVLVGDYPTVTDVEDALCFDFDKIAELLGLGLNPYGKIIRGIDDVDFVAWRSCVSYWAGDLGFELADTDLDVLTNAVHDANGLGVDGSFVTINDDIALECAEKLGFKMHWNGEKPDAATEK